MNATANDKVSAACGFCGTRYRVDPVRVGQQVRCAKCQAVFILTPSAAPAGPPPGPAAAPPRSAPPASGSIPGPGPAGLGPGPGPGFAPRPGPDGSGGQVPHHQQWIAGAMLEVRCLHCGLVIPLSRSFIGSYMGCPGCRERFVVGADGTALPLEPPLHRRLLEDKRFIKGALGVLAVVVIWGACVLVSGYWSKSKLVRAMTAVYPAPNYEVTPIKAPKKDRTVHKIADGSRQCPSVAYVRVAHKPTGMEFNRVVCEFDGQWNPTFRQRIADQVAADYIDDQGRSRHSFDPGAMPWTVYDPNAQNLGGLYKTVEVPEEQMVAREFGPALNAMTRTGDEPKDDIPVNGDSSIYEADGDYEEGDFDFNFNYDYEAEIAAHQERLYMAHAVMYPDQAEELFQSGKISERP